MCFNDIGMLKALLTDCPRRKGLETLWPIKKKKANMVRPYSKINGLVGQGAV